VEVRGGTATRTTLDRLSVSFESLDGVPRWPSPPRLPWTSFVRRLDRERPAWISATAPSDRREVTGRRGDFAKRMELLLAGAKREDAPKMSRQQRRAEAEETGEGDGSVSLRSFAAFASVAPERVANQRQPTPGGER
jgi:hypothetical protein